MVVDTALGACHARSMAVFDAELHLRLTGEAMVRAPPNPRSGPGWSSPIADAASAPVAVGALPLETATTIARDYEIALSMRGDQRSRGGMLRPAQPGRAVGQPFDRIRVALCDETVETSWGSLTVHYVQFGRDTT